ncbi:methyl-accepting chemotaxis protein [Krasilnikovia sp. MM14-A1259]|uniref:methyl-accepting chemotaxis protein n=1 Tax=Krasilnikovia sp. MM14-A1259 TaxID=3373539 RepID=UPI003809EF8F
MEQDVIVAPKRRRAVPRISSGLFGRISVSTRILAAVGMMALIAVVVGGGGLVAQARANSATDATYQHALVPATAIARLKSSIQRTTIFMSFGALTPDPAVSDKMLGVAAAEDAVQDEALASYRATSTFAHDPRLTVVADLVTFYRQVRQDKMAALARTHQTDEYFRVWNTEVNPRIQTANVALEGLIKAETAAAAKQSAASTASYQANRMFLIVVLAGGLVVALWVAWSVTRRIKRSLGAVADALTRVGDGDLTGRVEVRAQDELGRMGEALNRATANMGELIRAIDDSASELTDASRELFDVSGQIATSVNHISSQAEVVANAADNVSANVTELAASSEQMGSSITEISRNASHAVGVADRATEVADSTNRIVTELGDSSGRISEVIQTINSIAEQTNLLALNATIEAARAGDAGKGFAVVAGEVKDLAQETTRATSDIASRIAAIQNDITKAVDAIGEITSIVGGISSHQTSIATAVEEQTATASEINRTVNAAAVASQDIAGNIAAVANASQVANAGAGDAHTAAEAVSRKSDHLKTLIANFTV